MGKTKQLQPVKIKESELETLQNIQAKTQQLTSIIANCEIEKQNAINQFAAIQSEGQKFTQFLSKSYGLTESHTVDITTGEIKENIQEKNEPNS